MKHEDKITVTDYLKNLGIKRMEFFEEMYDHIVSSYENRKEQAQEIDEHIRKVVQPSFGGAKGIKRVMKAQFKERQKSINRRVILLFKEYLFGWPGILITLSIGTLIYQLNQLFEPEKILSTIMMLGAFTPALIVSIASGIFYSKCRKQGRPYRSSDLNHRVFILSFIGLNSINVILNLIGAFILGKQANGLELFASYPAIQISLSVFFILYALVAIRLFKEKFVIKLSL